MKFLRSIFTIILFIIFAWIAVTLIWLNKETIDVNLLFMTVNVKLGLALLGFFISGMGIGLLTMFMPVAKRSIKARGLDKKLKASEKEVENLRKLPMQDPE